MKTYRAIRHQIVRAKQSENDDSVHHPKEKINQIYKYIKGENLRILELFAGQGNLTKHFTKFGCIDAYDKKYLKTGDSYINVFDLIYKKKKYDVIDIDPYGFPNRLFPHIYLLIDKGLMFITMPKPYVNILNGITRTHLISYYGEHNPNINIIIEKFAMWGLCHWRKIEVLDTLDLKSVWRICIQVTKVKATEYTGVRNR